MLQPELIYSLYGLLTPLNLTTTNGTEFFCGHGNLLLHRSKKLGEISNWPDSITHGLPTRTWWGCSPQIIIIVSPGPSFEMRKWSPHFSTSCHGPNGLGTSHSPRKWGFVSHLDQKVGINKNTRIGLWNTNTCFFFFPESLSCDITKTCLVSWNDGPGTTVIIM